MIRYGHIGIKDKVAEGLEWYHTSADLSFVCNDKEIAQIVIEWADGHDMYMPPMSIDDVGQEGFGKLLIELRLHRAEVSAWTAYPAEMQDSVDEEEQKDLTNRRKISMELKAIEDVGVESQTRQKLADEEEMMEELPLPGVTSDERERKTAWLKLPRAARAAIRRMHMQFGHVKKAPFMEI